MFLLFLLFLFLFFLLLINFLNWRIIALQNFAAFCQTSTWISYRYTYITSLPFPSPSHPCRLIESLCLISLRATANSRWLSTLHNVCFHVTLFIHLTLSSPLPMSINLLFMSGFSIVALQIDSLVPSSWIPYICIIYDIYLSLSDFTLYNKLQVHPPH